MNRARAVALLALGCALAAAAAGTGPYLTSRAVAEAPVRRLIREAVAERQRQRLQQPTTVRADRFWWVEALLDIAVLGVFAVVVGYALWRGYRALRALLRLRLDRGGGGVRTASYDAGDEAHDDAVTALRRRVANELTALSADLDTTADAREVVIACYVRMERAFADAGSARRVDESPMELLERVLGEQYVPEADVRRLTALFTEARFSTHPVTDGMREEARRSLRNIAGALAVPA